MTKKETEIVLQTINGIYSNFLMGRDIKVIFVAWHRIFENQSFEIVFKKLDAWVLRESKPPNPCDLIIDVSWKEGYVHE